MTKHTSSDEPFDGLLINGYGIYNENDQKNLTAYISKHYILKADANRLVLSALYNIPIPGPAKKTKIKNGKKVANTFGLHHSEEYITGYINGSKKHFNDTVLAVKKEIAKLESLNLEGEK